MEAPEGIVLKVGDVIYSIHTPDPWTKMPRRIDEHRVVKVSHTHWTIGESWNQTKVPKKRGERDCEFRRLGHYYLTRDVAEQALADAEWMDTHGRRVRELISYGLDNATLRKIAAVIGYDERKPKP